MDNRCDKTSRLWSHVGNVKSVTLWFTTEQYKRAKLIDSVCRIYDRFVQDPKKHDQEIVHVVNIMLYLYTW